MKRRQFATDFAAVLSVLLILTGIFLSIATGAPVVQGSDSDLTTNDAMQNIEQSVYDSTYQVESSITTETYGLPPESGEEGSSTTDTVYDSAYQATEPPPSGMQTEALEAMLVPQAPVQLSVSKSAQGFRELTYHWKSLQKQADSQMLVIKPGESALIKYGITAVREAERERAGVRGVINIEGTDQVNPADYVVTDQVFVSVPILAKARLWFPIPTATAIFPGVAPQIPYEIEFNPRPEVQQIMSYLKLNSKLVYQNRVEIRKKSDLSLCASTQVPFMIPNESVAINNANATLTDNMVCPKGFSIQGYTPMNKTLNGSETIGYAVYVTNIGAVGPSVLVNQATLVPEGQQPLTASVEVVLSPSDMTPRPSLSVVVTGDHRVAKPLSLLKYGYKITNNGNVPFDNVTLVDDKVPLIPPSSYVFSNLGVGESVYASGLISLPPELPGTPGWKLKNTATAKGIIMPSLTKGILPLVIAQAEWTVEVLPWTGHEQPGLALDVTADPAVAHPGDTVIYAYKIINNGEYDLRELKLTDNKFDEIELPASDLFIETTMPPVTKSYTIPSDAEPGTTLVNIGTVRGKTLLGQEITAVNDAFVVIAKDDGGGGSPGGNGGSNSGAGSAGGDGPSADYGQGGQASTQSLSVPSESLVGGPVTVVTPNEQLSIPQDPNVSAPRMANKALAHNGELPFTGGKPLAFEMLGLAMLILSLSFREQGERSN
ncbi:MAG: hypothetical protein ACM3UZ_00555 [Acidobacteriota bacterium]